MYRIYELFRRDLYARGLLYITVSLFFSFSILMLLLCFATFFLFLKFRGAALSETHGQSHFEVKEVRPTVGFRQWRWGGWGLQYMFACAALFAFIKFKFKTNRLNSGMCRIRWEGALDHSARSGPRTERKEHVSYWMNE